MRSLASLTFTAIVLVPLAACQQNAISLNAKQQARGEAETTGTRFSDSSLHAFKRDGALWLRLASGKAQRLAEEGMGYRVSISPNGRWIAVDTAI